MSSEAFTRISINDHAAWLEERRSHIQATDASVILGINPWKNAFDLWSEKMGIKEEEDISDKPYVIYGKRMEEHIRESFLLDCPYFECEYHEFDILVNNERPWQACTLDGELTVIADSPWNLPKGSKGVLECKTGSFRNFEDLNKWVEFPLYYHAQQCHQLAVTEWAFNISASRVKREPQRDEDGGFPEIKTLYHLIKVKDVLDDIEEINSKELSFWRSLEAGIRPDYKFFK